MVYFTHLEIRLYMIHQETPNIARSIARLGLRYTPLFVLKIVCKLTSAACCLQIILVVLARSRYWSGVLCRLLGGRGCAYASHDQPHERQISERHLRVVIVTN